ncbi:hypothetical protein KQI65_01935 [bacterium]|nr:hypothetical protein [bacterium]
MNKQKETTPERKLRISVSATERNETPEHNQIFYPREILISQLEQTFKARNFSAILWRPEKRAIRNFARAYCLMIDLDDGSMTFEQAAAKLQELNLNHVIITSRSHGKPHDRFHILIPLKRAIVTAKQYTNAVVAFASAHFPNRDTNLENGAASFLGSPDNARFVMDFDREDLDIDVDAIEEIEMMSFDFVEISKALRINESWDESLEVMRMKPKEVVRAVEQPAGTQIFCPFHDDNSPSAFIGFSDTSQNHFIHCSACAKTYWHEVDGNVMDRRLDKFWSHGESVYEAGFTGSEFSFQKIGKEKFFVMASAKKEEDKQKLYEHLVRNKHLHSLGIVEYRGSLQVTEPTYTVYPSIGTTKVDIPCIEERREDNSVIEDYLKRTFGPYKTFIKQWLAAYCYTNHQKLPTLILTGPRGTGKNTFAELIAVIYDQLSVTVQDIGGAFNPFAEKKLGILDEALRGGKLQYAELKKLSGQEWFEINKKYMPQYKVRNNLNLIILSNELLPITVASSELPTDPGNNQFFVYDMPQIPAGSIDPDFKYTLRRTIGHYIRTELKTVFDHIHSNMTGCRYTIPTPITEWEERLFKFSKNEVEILVEGLIGQIEERYHENFSSTTQDFLQAGYLLSEMVSEHLNGKPRLLNTIRLQLMEQGVIKEGESVRRTVGGQKRSCYELTDDFRARLAAAYTYLPSLGSEKPETVENPDQKTLEFMENG